MNAISTIAPASVADEILVFMPGIKPEELEIRAKLRRYRNVATALIARTESPTARQQAWIVVEYATETMFLPASAEFLADVSKFCARTMICAMHAERLETSGAAG